ncbi:Aste57867_20637 [Aphanomyces stellatus]|uniref:folate gamma-glutamyl hydrolase n=1 Tax=Aphanomyces stellatus TaxID=120398 RepID=A0A485LGN9_9STRA|nr:hypothetical protein As57867_020569 [Aphanomyces stellatus]VFT97317.1 Aste57867_20637 [Aphanomyces stellatus]
MSEDTSPILPKTDREARRGSREGHYGLKAFMVGLSVVAVAIVCLVVYAVPLPQHRGGVVPQVVLTPNPVIAVLSLPSSTEPHADETIESSYIKWIESAGGRAMRIPFHASNDDIAALLCAANGVLLPGGTDDVPPAAAAFIFNHILALHENESHVPLWATGRAMSWLLQLKSGNNSILDVVNATNMSSVLAFPNGLIRGSRMFGYSPVFDVMEAETAARSLEDGGIYPRHMAASPSLASFFKPLATAIDRQGQKYVAAIEGIDNPIYGVHFHPEKNAYDFGHGSVDHSANAILSSQALAHFFVGEARRNNHRFDPTTTHTVQWLDYDGELRFNASTTHR